MSNVEQWEHDEQRAMETEITTLREQVDKWKSLHESLTKLNEAQERRHEKQVKKLENRLNKDSQEFTILCAKETEKVLREQLAVLAEHNAKMREALVDCEQALDECRDYPLTYDSVIEAISLPGLATPALNKYRAEGMRMAADFAVVVRDDWVHVDDNHKAYAADYLVSSIRARADELEKINAAPFA